MNSSGQASAPQPHYRCDGCGRDLRDKRRRPSMNITQDGRWLCERCFDDHLKDRKVAVLEDRADLALTQYRALGTDEAYAEYRAAYEEYQAARVALSRARRQKEQDALARCLRDLMGYRRSNSQRARLPWEKGFSADTLRSAVCLEHDHDTHAYNDTGKVPYSAWIAFLGLCYAYGTARLNPLPTMYIRELSSWQLCDLVAEIAVNLNAGEHTQSGAWEYLKFALLSVHEEEGKLVRQRSWPLVTGDAVAPCNTKIIRERERRQVDEDGVALIGLLSAPSLAHHKATRAGGGAPFRIPGQDRWLLLVEKEIRGQSARDQSQTGADAATRKPTLRLRLAGLRP
jgi:hypothetical protein